ncbi:hypothetical protein AVEN_3958-1 [Araneus ventricosus]|uniref:Uncharacterized protein n=1 Tax=Araneus ventricosus TaxID=182803 RepID=A0A4Y2SQ67_ARAVE|nr:hypothetical protein AVEN_3958-1 [Araneus ventricosus]
MDHYWVSDGNEGGGRNFAQMDDNLESGVYYQFDKTGVVEIYRRMRSAACKNPGHSPNSELLSDLDQSRVSMRIFRGEDTVHPTLPRWTVL